MGSDSVSSASGKIMVLLVDDEPDQMELTKLSLEGLDPGLEVSTIPNPYEAIGLLEMGGFDCLVSDYQMPGMDGIELASAIRKRNDVPFIIYTGRGSEEVASKAFAAGVDDYVRKEKDMGHYMVLARRIRQAVARRKVGVRLGAGPPRKRGRGPWPAPPE